MAVPTQDGCWVFASLTAFDRGDESGIAVLQKHKGKTSLVRVVPVKGDLSGMTLTHDGKLLIVANGEGVAILDLTRLISGQAGPVLGYLKSEPEIPPDTALYMGPQRTSQTQNAGSNQVNVTNDDRFLFVADEWTQSITVINLSQARSSGFSQEAIIGRIPVGVLPIALVFSPDERYLYTTSQIGLKRYGWPVECKPEGTDPARTQPANPAGAILVVDVVKAKSDPKASVIAMVPAGCSPVRLAISPNGDLAFVTARNSNAVLAFDSRKLLADPGRALVGMVPVGSAPVGLTVFEDGRKVIVTNSNRFSGDSSDKQSLTVIDTNKIAAGAAAVIGQVPAGAFPREIRAAADQRTLFVTNYRSKTLELVDVKRLSVILLH